tara:strand:+ start:695 stop:1243 length:549 start_codon:yes stop_codon:yes gene_type:complete
MSILKVDTINEKTSGNGVAIPGHVIQVKQTVLADTFSTAIGPNFAEITEFRTLITPSSTSSKILIHADLSVGVHYYQARGRILRDSTPIGLGNQRGSNRKRVSWNIIDYTGAAPGNSLYHFWPVSFSFLDSPATTNEITYSLDMGGYNTGYNVYLNRAHTDPDYDTYNGTPQSTLTLMEIAQ